MSLEQEVELIRRLEIFSKIGAAKQKLLCFSSDRLTYGAGEVLFRKGDVGDACYVVIDGLVEISVEEDEARLILNTLGSNELIGEIAIFGQVPRTATATAKTRAEVLRISSDLFQSVVRENPEASIELIRILAKRLANTTAKLANATALLANAEALLAKQSAPPGS